MVLVRRDRLLRENGALIQGRTTRGMCKDGGFDQIKIGASRDLWGGLEGHSNVL